MVVRTPVVLAATLALILTAFGGCTDLLGGGEAGDEDSPSLHRVVVMELDEDKIHSILFDEPDGVDAILRALMEVSFVYTHAGPAVAPSELTVRFTGDDGQLRARTLDAYTSAALLRPGVTVTVPGVHLASAVTIEQDGAVLVDRLPVQRDWITLEGIPLPVAGSRDGEARWTQEVEGGLTFAVRDMQADVEDTCYFDMESGEYQCETVAVQVDRLDLDYGINLASTVRAGLEAGSSRMFLEASLTGDLTASAAGSASVDGEAVAGDVAAWGEAEASLRGELALQGRQVTAAGSSGSVRVDGGVSGWFEADGEREDIDLPGPGSPSPFWDEQWDTGMTPVPSDLPEPDATLLHLLEALWSVSLDVGDRFRFHVEMDDNWGYGFSWTEVATVTERGQRTVGGATVPALRIVGETDRQYWGPDDRMDFTTMETVMWIHAETYLALHYQQDIRESFDVDDLLRLMGPDMEDVLDVLSVGDASLVANVRAVGTLDRLDTDLAVPGLLYMLPAGLAVGAMGATTVFGAFMDDLMYDAAEADWAREPPGVAFQSNGSEGRIVVVMAESGADWWSYRFDGPMHWHAAVRGDPAQDGVRPGGPLAMSLPDPWSESMVQAGDEIRFCTMDGEAAWEDIEIIFDYSMLVAVHSIQAPPC